MKSNSLSIFNHITNVDIYEMTEEQITDIKDMCLQQININQLEEKIMECVLHLSGVGEPCLGADIKYIAMDNKQRLNIIYELLNTFELFKAQTKNLKRNKSNCNTDNFDYVFDYVSRLQKMSEYILNYVQFRQQEYIENNKEIMGKTGEQLYNNDKKLLQ